METISRKNYIIFTFFFISMIALTSIGRISDIIYFKFLPVDKVKGVITASELQEAMDGNRYACTVVYEYKGILNITTPIIEEDEKENHRIGDSVNVLISSRAPEKVVVGEVTYGISYLIVVLAVLMLILVLVPKKDKKDSLPAFEYYLAKNDYKYVDQD